MNRRWERGEMEIKKILRKSENLFFWLMQNFRHALNRQKVKHIRRSLVFIQMKNNYKHLTIVEEV